MCFHKSLTAKYNKLAEYYSTNFSHEIDSVYQPRFHENGFDFQQLPIVTSGRPQDMQMFHWGLVPHWVKDEAAGKKIRLQTLNCISEEMFDKPSFQNAAQEGKRCLIPCTGFMEWKWLDEKGKSKIPYYIRLKDHDIFSIAGLYTRWLNKTNNTYYYSYTILTTEANPLMAEIHNSKKRMPVIIPRTNEKDWLSRSLSKDDVLALCKPINDSFMSAHTISKLISSKHADTNVPEILKEYRYEQAVTGSLF